MLNSRQRLGKNGEATVIEYLRQIGYLIVTQNYRCKMGEIDIIAKDGLELVFVEVKTRTGIGYGTPASAVDLRKQRQISKTALHYLAEHHLFDTPARFDVISVLIDNSKNKQIDHLSNAFDLCE